MTSASRGNLEVVLKIIRCQDMVSGCTSVGGSGVRLCWRYVYHSHTENLCVVAQVDNDCFPCPLSSADWINLDSAILAPWRAVWCHVDLHFAVSSHLWGDISAAHKSI